MAWSACLLAVHDHPRDFGGAFEIALKIAVRSAQLVRPNEAFSIFAPAKFARRWLKSPHLPQNDWPANSFS